LVVFAALKGETDHHPNLCSDGQSMPIPAGFKGD